ncbi:MAG: site-specific integrase [Lachnospiraceae bacterium]|nr:site-specific integrase [Lachnospiraceae bacterium]
MERRKDNKGRVLQKGESQRKDGRYVYQYSDIYGKRKCIYANALSDLRKQEKQINRDLDDNIDTVGAEITLNEQFDKYISLKTQIRNSTKQNYIDLWNGNLRNNVLGKKKLCDIKKSDILKFYNFLSERGLKYSTIKTFNCMISPCFDLAVDDDIIRKNPSNGCLGEFNNDSGERISLTLQQQEVFLEFIRQSKVYSAHYPLIMFMIGTAVRCGEAIGLTWDDVDFKNREVSINHQLIYKKTGKSYGFYADSPKTDSGVRIIPMTTDVYKALIEQRQNQLSKGWRTNTEIGGYSDFVFSTKNRNPIMPSAVNSLLLNIVNRYNAAVGDIELPHISAHNLRHTGCTRMAEAGVDPKVLQYIMGHGKISVTMEVYNHVSAERNRKEMDKMEKIRLLG